MHIMRRILLTIVMLTLTIGVRHLSKVNAQSPGSCGYMPDPSVMQKLAQRRRLATTHVMLIIRPAPLNYGLVCQAAPQKWFKRFQAVPQPTIHALQTKQMRASTPTARALMPAAITEGLRARPGTTVVNNASACATAHSQHQAVRTRRVLEVSGCAMGHPSSST